MNRKPKKRTARRRYRKNGDPASNFVNGLGHILAEESLKKLTPYISAIFGSQPSQLEQTMYQLEMQNLAADIAEAKERQHSSKTNMQLGNFKVEEKEMKLDKARYSPGNPIAARTDITVRVRTELISGALEIGANADGFGGSVEQQDAHKWAQSLNVGKVILILGRRGSGKTALAAKVVEFCQAFHKMPGFWLGLPSIAKTLLPTWINIVDCLEQCPKNAVVICDEAGLEFLSLNFTKKRNLDLRKMLFVARQRKMIFVFAAQHSRDIDASIMRMVDCVIFKEPSLTQPENERREILTKAKRAASAFKQIPPERRLAAAYVIDHSYEGIIESKLPSFWSEGLSNIYGDLNLADLNGQPRQLTSGSADNGHAIDESERFQNIKELDATGKSLREIADIVDCTVWQVRKCLGKV